MKPKKIKTVRINGMEKIKYRGSYVGVRLLRGKYYPVIYRGEDEAPCLTANQEESRKSSAYKAALRGRELIDMAIRIEAGRRDIPIEEQEELERRAHKDWTRLIESTQKTNRTNGNH